VPDAAVDTASWLLHHGLDRAHARVFDEDVRDRLPWAREAVGKRSTDATAVAMTHATA